MKNHVYLKPGMARPARALSLFAGLACALLLACGGGGEDQVGEVDGVDDVDDVDEGRELFGFIFTSELVTQAEFPVKLAPAPDGRLFYSEYNFNREGMGKEPRKAAIRIIDANGQLLDQPFAEIDVGNNRDWGLFGLAFDPEFETNRYVYAYFIAPSPKGIDVIEGHPTVMRFTDVNNRGTDPTPLPLNLPELTDQNPDHTGGGLRFGPDGYLYLSLGDLSARDHAQDLSVLPGKILRFDSDGSAPPDNPFVDMPSADPLIFAYGVRNVYDFTFHPITGRMYAADNGSENCDELDIIDEGQNYGWPQSLNEEVCHNPGAEEAIYFFAKPDTKADDLGSNPAPTGVEFLTDEGDLLLACESNTFLMRLFRLEGPNYGEVLDQGIIAEDCILDVVRAAEGTIYYSNQGEIRRLVVQPASQQ